MAKKDTGEKERDPSHPQQVHDHGDLIIRRGEKYFCPECQAEVITRQPCPTCGKVIDWDAVMIQLRKTP